MKLGGSLFEDKGIVFVKLPLPVRNGKLTGSNSWAAGTGMVTERRAYVRARSERPSILSQLSTICQFGRDEAFCLVDVLARAA